MAGGAGGLPGGGRAAGGRQVRGPQALGAHVPASAAPRVPGAGKAMGVPGSGVGRGWKSVIPVGKSNNRSIQNKKDVSEKKKKSVLFTHTELDQVIK